MHYVYVCRKLAGADEQCLQLWGQVEAQIKKEEIEIDNDLLEDSDELEEEKRSED